MIDEHIVNEAMQATAPDPVPHCHSDCARGLNKVVLQIRVLGAETHLCKRVGIIVELAC